MSEFNHVQIIDSLQQSDFVICDKYKCVLRTKRGNPYPIFDQGRFCLALKAVDTETNKTICLAVSPSLKQYGIGGRARLFEVISKVKEINQERLKKTRHFTFNGKSYLDPELKNNPEIDNTFKLIINNAVESSRMS